MTYQIFIKGCASTLLAMSLTACGNGGDGGGLAGGSGGSGGGSVGSGAFFSEVKALVATSPDTAEPMEIDSVTVTSPETSDPESVDS